MRSQFWLRVAVRKHPFQLLIQEGWGFHDMSEGKRFIRLQESFALHCLDGRGPSTPVWRRSHGEAAVSFSRYPPPYPGWLDFLGQVYFFFEVFPFLYLFFFLSTVSSLFEAKLYDNGSWLAATGGVDED